MIDKKAPKNLEMITKVPTGVAGFDLIARGGIPEGRTTLVVGTSGSGKTIFATAFLYYGLSHLNERGVFVTFEETPEDIMRNMLGFGWDLLKYKKESLLHFVHVPTDMVLSQEVGGYDLQGLITRVTWGVKKVNAKRVVIDSISALLDRLKDKTAVRSGLFKLALELKKLNVTTILTAEHEEEVGGIFKPSFVEFVSDNVIILHSFLYKKFRKRNIEILKFRGTGYDSTLTPIIIDNRGLSVYPHPSTIIPEGSSFEKISSGIRGIDEMFNRGILKYSTSLLTGASGSGKTIMAMHFVIEGAKRNERCLYIAFEESKAQLLRNAEMFGWPMEEYTQRGLIEIIANPPELLPAESYYQYILDNILRIKPQRFVLDSLSGLERIYDPDSFHEFVVALNGFLKSQKATSYLLNTTDDLLGISKITKAHLSTITDNIVMLHYVEIEGDVRRGINLLKVRGSQHDKRIHEFSIEKDGIELKGPFSGYSRVITGIAQKVNETPVYSERLKALSEEFLSGQIDKNQYFEKLQRLKEEIHPQFNKNSTEC